MYLKKGINSIAFLRAIDECEADVLLHTKEQDVLNLRSQLCRFIFAAAKAEDTFFEEAQVECKNPADYKKLRDFLTE